jgi:predicted transposase/invertase (TIGR01784 family)
MPTETKLVRFDWALKNILRDKANFDVLEGFLTALLQEEIAVLEILESESNQSDFAKKFNRVDILVKDKNERKIIIEVQSSRETGYLERILWGASKLIVDTLELGDDYRNISKIISISIVYFDFGLCDDNEYVYYGVTDLQGLHTHKPFTFRRRMADKTFKTLHTKDLFPEFYLLRVEHFQDVIKTELDEWIYMLKYSAIKTDFKSKNIDKAKEKLTLLKMNPQKRKDYEKYMVSIAVERDVLETARTEGQEEGMRAEKRALVKNSLQQGLELPMIAAITGLNLEEIQKIRNE